MTAHATVPSLLQGCVAEQHDTLSRYLLSAISVSQLTNQQTLSINIFLRHWRSLKHTEMPFAEAQVVAQAMEVAEREPFTGSCSRCFWPSALSSPPYVIYTGMWLSCERGVCCTKCCAMSPALA
jgi:hypothetical protein